MLLSTFVVLLEICIHIIIFCDLARATLVGCLKHCLYLPIQNRVSGSLNNEN